MFAGISHSPAVGDTASAHSLGECASAMKVCGYVFLATIRGG